MAAMTRRHKCDGDRDDGYHDTDRRARSLRASDADRFQATKGSISGSRTPEIGFVPSTIGADGFRDLFEVFGDFESERFTQALVAGDRVRPVASRRGVECDPANGRNPQLDP